MSSTTTTATILGVDYTVINLGSDPTATVRRWRNAILEVAKKVNNLKDPANGSVFEILTDAEYALYTMADNPDDPEGPQIPKAKPTCPAYPPSLHGQGTIAANSNREDVVATITRHMAAAVGIKQIILESMGPAIVEEGRLLLMCFIR
jgi:hypothetical protein